MKNITKLYTSWMKSRKGKQRNFLLSRLQELDYNESIGASVHYEEDRKYWLEKLSKLGVSYGKC